ncbi:MAG: GxxExxY protein [Bacteroidota bacterium]
MTNEQLNDLSKTILDSCITVHKEMGPGLLESIYELCLIRELEQRGIKVTSQISIPLLYKGTELSKDFRIDILVENEIILEIKSVEILLPVHEAQIISYLKLSDKKLGFLINFNVSLLKNGFKRFVHNF